MAEFTFEDLRRIVAKCTTGLDGADLGPDDVDVEFSSLGLDSLVVLEIAATIQEELGTRVPDEAVEGMKTPADVIAYVNRRAVA